MAAILAALARHPSVTEVEVKPDGSWRPSGSTGRFLSVLDVDSGDVFAPEPGAPGSAVKQEPGLEGLDGDGDAAGANGAAGGGSSDDESEEEDAAEELR